MSEQEKSPEQQDNSGHEKPGAETARCGGRCSGRCGRRWWAKLLVVAVIIGGVVAWHHHAHAGYCSFGHGFSHASRNHELDPARMREHAERMTEHMLERVDANVAQRQKVLAIARTAADDLQPLIEAHRATRASLYSALTAETVDPARLEQLRSETLQRADAVSRRLTQEIADMAAVLSPAQRRKLMARWAPSLEG